MFSKQQEIEFAKFFMQIFNSERNKKKSCFYPGCNEKQINSHILQKNGILSGISEDKHLYTPDVNMFDENSFVIKKTGLNKAYSFPCFCSFHDSNIFSEIENENLDYSKYRTFLLFTIRTALNEFYRKSIMVKLFDVMKNKYEHLNNNYSYNEFQENQKLGVSDLQKLIDVIWKDLNENKESFVFLHRKISKLEICTSAFYNFETSKELNDYKNIHGKNKEDVSQIFFNFFPLENQSILMMGYLKKDELLTKQYVNQYFKTSEKKFKD